MGWILTFLSHHGLREGQQLHSSRKHSVVGLSPGILLTRIQAKVLQLNDNKIVSSQGPPNAGGKGCSGGHES